MNSRRIDRIDFHKKSWKLESRMPTLLKIVIFSLISSLSLGAQGENDAEEVITESIASKCSSRYLTISKRLKEIDATMKKLPVLSDIDALGSHGFHSMFSPILTDHWLEISWPSPQRFDGMALVPTRLTTQSGQASNYGFPEAFRIEATRNGDGKRFILIEVLDTHLKLRQGEPLYLDVNATDIRSLRIVPLKLPHLGDKNELVFSIAEWMVFRSLTNIARNAKFSAKGSTEGEYGWGLRCLNDEQTALGPPESPPMGNSLGWHGDADPLWAIIDLGSVKNFDAVRLIPAKGDGPTKGPGFGFPVRFHFETCSDLSVGDWTMVWQTGLRNIVNPGYNAMTIPFTAAKGRYVRFSVDQMHAPDLFTTPRLLLSELEVLHGNQNLSAYCSVTSSDRRKVISHDGIRVWSVASLTDGYTSSGKTISERLWVRQLSNRFDLLREKTSLSAERQQLLKFWNRLLIITIIACLTFLVITLAVWLNRVRKGSRKVVESLRTSISNDLHDEVGSNLATIALLSELKPCPDNMDNINRLSRETSLALREIVEITLAPDSNNKTVTERLREIASLMLSEHQWTFVIEETASFNLQQRKNIVFFFKESLHNIIRHANASHVNITFKRSPNHYHLFIEDDGIGLPECGVENQSNLRTLRQRAESLQGAFLVESKPGLGTRLSLQFPIAH
jgi:signal transduction histidine kinase